MEQLGAPGSMRATELMTRVKLVRQWLTATVLLLALAGCATHPKVDPSINWNSRIGSYTYEQAVSELGKPCRCGRAAENRARSNGDQSPIPL